MKDQNVRDGQGWRDNDSHAPTKETWDFNENT